MGGKEIALGLFVLLFASSAALLLLGDDTQPAAVNQTLISSGDPLFQGEGHDHKNASQHVAGTDNMELLDFNPLSTPGNAEVQVATTPDGRTYE